MDKQEEDLTPVKIPYFALRLELISRHVVRFEHGDKLRRRDLLVQGFKAVFNHVSLSQQQ